MSRANKWGIYACKDGVVVATYVSKSYGNCIIIEHKDGYRTLYGHNSKLLVGDGQEVKKGDFISIMGDTGHGIPKPNKHFHLGLIPPNRPLTNLIDNCINPVPWLTKGGCYPCNTLVSNGFQEDYGSYFHEGIDFSGLEKNVIKDWQLGIKADTRRYY